MGLLLLIVLVLLLVGGLPTWNYSRNWGYRPVGIIGPILVIGTDSCSDGLHPSQFLISTTALRNQCN